MSADMMLLLASFATLGMAAKNIVFLQPPTQNAQNQKTTNANNSPKKQVKTAQNRVP